MNDSEHSLRRQSVAWLFCFSLANLVLLKPWHYVQIGYAFDSYYKMSPNLPIIAIMSNVLALTLIFRIVMTIGSDWRTPWVRSLARWGFLLLLLVLLNTFRQISKCEALAIGRLVLNPLAWLVGIGAVVTIIRWPRKVFVYSRTAVLVVSPLGFLAIAQAALHVETDAPGLKNDATRPIISPQFPALPGRVVWIVFDELDQRVLCDERPESLALPEFERLRRESLYFPAAYPPSSETLTSLPALLCGRPVTNAQPCGRQTLFVDIYNEMGRLDYRSLPNIFTEARHLGLRSAVVGHYHPYPLVLDRDADESFWLSRVVEDRLRASSVLPAMLEQLRWIYSEPAMAERRSTIEMYRALKDRLMSAATNQQIGLTFAHLPVPHAPGIWDPTRNDFSVRHRPGVEEYLGNVALCDATLCELRQCMEAADLWNGTMIIVTSDHWWRAPEGESLLGPLTYQVPLLIKMQTQTESLEYAEPCSNLQLYNLVLGNLRGEIQTPSQVVAYLDQHREDIPFDLWKYSLAESSATRDE